MEKLILYITLIILCFSNCSENNEITSIQSFITKKNTLTIRSLLVSDSIDDRLLIPGVTTYNQIQNQLKNCRCKQEGVICAMVGSFYPEECYYPELGISYSILHPSFSAENLKIDVKVNDITVFPNSKVHLQNGVKPFEISISEIINLYGVCQDVSTRDKTIILRYKNIAFSYNLKKDSLLNYSIYFNRL